MPYVLHLNPSKPGYDAGDTTYFMSTDVELVSLKAFRIIIKFAIGHIEDLVADETLFLSGDVAADSFYRITINSSGDVEFTRTTSAIDTFTATLLGAVTENRRYYLLTATVNGDTITLDIDGSSDVVTPTTFNSVASFGDMSIGGEAGGSFVPDIIIDQLRVEKILDMDILNHIEAPISGSTVVWKVGIGGLYTDPSSTGSVALSVGSDVMLEYSSLLDKYYYYINDSPLFVNPVTTFNNSLYTAALAGMPNLSGQDWDIYLLAGLRRIYTGGNEATILSLQGSNGSFKLQLDTSQLLRYVRDNAGVPTDSSSRILFPFDAHLFRLSKRGNNIITLIDGYNIADYTIESGVADYTDNAVGVIPDNLTGLYIGGTQSANEQYQSLSVYEIALVWGTF